MRPMPTIADALYRESLRDPKWVGRFRDVATVPKFVLDGDVYSLLDDLMHGQVLDSVEKFRNVRLMGRMPFEKVWIEPSIDIMKAEVESREGKGSWVKGKETALAWYIERHPTLDTCIRLTPVMWSDSRLGPLHFSIIWSTDDSPATWPYWHKIVDQDGQNPVAHLLGMRTGIKDAGSFDSVEEGVTNTAAAIAQWMSKMGDHVTISYNEMYELYDQDNPQLEEAVIDMYEHAIHSWLNVMVFLATIDELPVVSREVTPSKGYFARGKHRPFLTHRVIKLSIPVERATKKLVNHILAPSRHRRHAVRGFWRRLTQDRIESCGRFDHDWYLDGKYRLCLTCGSEGVFVKEHERGDAALGYVTHDYHVERGKF